MFPKTTAASVSQVGAKAGLSRRNFLIGGGIAAISLPLLAGCRPSGGGGGGAKKSYTMWSSSDTVELQKFFYDKYRKEVDPDFELQLSEIPTGQSLRAKVISASAAGQLPEVLDLPMNYTSDFATYSMFEPLNGVLADDTASKYSMYERVWNWGNSGGVAGWQGGEETFAIPYLMSVFVPAYRADMFRTAGVDFPTTWEELITAGKALTKAPDSYALMVPTSGDLMDEFHPFLMQAGASYVNDDLTEAFPDREAAYKGFEFYRDLSGKHGIAPRQAPDRYASDPAQRLASGQVAITTLATLSVSALQRTGSSMKFGRDSDWFVSPFWAGPGGSKGYYNASSLSLRRGVKDSDAIVEYFQWMLEPEQQKLVYTEFNRPPMNTSTWDSFSDDPAFEIYTQAIENSERQGGFKGWKLAEFIIDRAVEQIVDGGDVKTIVDAAGTDMIQALQNA